MRGVTPRARHGVDPGRTLEPETWRLTAELERKLGRDEDAELTLREARRQFRSRFDQAQAIEILRMIREIAPWDHEIVLDLARLYARTDQPGRALRLLEALAARSEGARLRRAMMGELPSRGGSRIHASIGRLASRVSARAGAPARRLW